MKHFPRHIYGLHAVRSALTSNASQVQELWVQDTRKDKRLESLVALAEAAKIPVDRITRRELDALVADAAHQGVVAGIRIEPKRLGEQDLEGLLRGIDGPPFLLVLDGVQDPHNLGACLRTADAAGVHAVIIPRDRAAGMTPVVRKVACGAAESVPLLVVTNLARTLRHLRDAGVWLYGAADSVDKSLYSCDLKGPLAVVLGSEGKGLRRLTRELCDELVAIPMSGVVESLNVSVAAGILLYEARRQRSSAGV
mgnify:FL=1